MWADFRSLWEVPRPQRLSVPPRPQEMVPEDIARTDHSKLHLYRVGFQTVGQPWFVLQPPKQRQIEPEAQYTAAISYSLLFGRAVATVVGQPWYLWTQPQRLIEPEAEPYRVDHGRMHQFRPGFQTVGQPAWALFWKSNIPDVTDATFPQYPLHDRLHRYRTGYQTVGQGWPIFWKSNIPDVTDSTAPAYPSANNLHLYRVGIQTVGQPTWSFRWKGYIPSAEDEIFRSVDHGKVYFPFGHAPGIVLPQPWFIYTWKSQTAGAEEVFELRDRHPYVRVTIQTIAPGIPIPNMVGLWWYDACKVLISLGLIPSGPIKLAIKPYLDGYVVAQSVIPGTLVAVNTPVVLTVAKPANLLGFADTENTKPFFFS